MPIGLVVAPAPRAIMGDASGLAGWRVAFATSSSHVTSKGCAMNDRYGDGGHSMNVGEAKEIFRSYRRGLAAEYEDVVRFCRKNSVDAPLKNGSFLHALTLTDLILTHCDKSFRMLTGGAGDGFVSCLKDSFVEMLERLKASKGKARILVLNGPTDTEVLRSLREGFPDTLEVRKGIARGNVAHFIVADNDMVRDEKPHIPINDASDADTIKADVYFHSPPIAELFSSRFDAIWTKVGPAER